MLFMRYFQLNKLQNARPCIQRLLICYSIFVSLTACGGGDNATETQADSNNNASTPTIPIAAPAPEPLARGDWKSTTSLARHDLAAIRRAGGVLSPEISPETLRYTVNLHRITYTTTDGDGNLINVSGALALPEKNPQLASPLLSFQHGTIFRNAEAPSNEQTADAAPVLLASLGYVVVAADYVGYGVSQGTPHPYLQKEPSARAVIDLIKAARFWLAAQSITLNQQLFLTGYSQGGHVTMAAHQTIEAANIEGMTVTASIPGAGPYNMVATLDELTSRYAFRQRRQVLLATEAATAPNMAQRLSPPIAEALANLAISQIVPTDSDISFDNKIAYDYLRTDGMATANENVHDWRAKAPVRLYHGRDDDVVPFLNATDAFTAMQAKNSNDVMLAECLTTPADHDTCIPPYGLFVIEYFGEMAQGL